MRRNQFHLRKNTHEKESIKIKMKTDYYCTNCLENFTKDTLWDFYMLDDEPVCEKCYDELCAEL